MIFRHSAHVADIDASLAIHADGVRGAVRLALNVAHAVVKMGQLLSVQRHNPDGGRRTVKYVRALAFANINKIIRAQN